MASASHDLTDKTIVFRKLQAKSENKVCFDCSAKDPTCASVTYGGGLVAQERTTKVPKENLYEQIAEETAPFVPAASSAGGYNDDLQSGGGTQERSHDVATPKSSSFSADFGMDSALPHQSSSNPSKVLVGESDEARKVFSNAKSISETTLKKSMVSLICRAKAWLQNLASDIADRLEDAFPKKFGLDDLRTQVTELMQKLDGKDADAIPLDTRFKWVDRVSKRVSHSTAGMDLMEISGPMVIGLRTDSAALLCKVIYEQALSRKSD